MTTDKNNSPVTAPMWWDGGDRAITAREKALIEEHSPSSFSIPLVPATPSARWAADALPDPHGNRYACERAALTLGNLTDDELANAVFLHGNEQPAMADLAAGKALAGIVYLTAAKDRIRWLSRALADATAPQPAELAEQQGDHVPDAILRCAIRAFERARKDYKLRLCNEEPQGKKEAIEALSMEAALQAAFALAATGKQHVGESNRTTVDSGALRLALNVLRRAGKGEVAEALESTAARGQQVGEVQGDALSLAEHITDHLCHHEYDIGGRSELLACVTQALAAQAGQGAVPCATSASHALRVAYRHLDMVSMRVSHCKDAAIIESAMKDVDTFDLNAAISALAARQPGAQEPADLSQFRDAVFCMENYTGTLPRRYWDLGLTAFKAEAKRLRTLVESSGVIR